MNNLIKDPWIPIQRRSGKLDHICPAQLAETDDPAVLVQSPDITMDASIVLILIGMFQAAFNFTNPARARWLKDPPTPEKVAKTLIKLAAKFNITAPIGKPAFMQVKNFEEGVPISTISVQNIILSQSMGDNTGKEGRDWFHQQKETKVCLPCAAVCLFANQVFLQSDGGGSGNSPLANNIFTLNKGKTLWETILFNFIPNSIAKKEPSLEDGVSLKQRFPWEMTPERPLHYVPDMAQAYWVLIKYYRLEETHEGCCDLCGREGQVISELTKVKSPKYECYSWEHPLIPEYVNKQKKQRRLDLEQRRIGFHLYPQATRLVPSTEKGTGGKAATAFTEMCDSDHLEGFERSQWIFGARVNRGALQGWEEKTYTVFNVKPRDRKVFQSNLVRAVDFLDSMFSDLRKTITLQVQRAAKNPNVLIYSIANQLLKEYLSKLEEPFMELVRNLHRMPKGDDLCALEKAWASTVFGVTMLLFRGYARCLPAHEASHFSRILKGKLGRLWFAYCTPKEKTDDE